MIEQVNTGTRKKEDGSGRSDEEEKYDTEVKSHAS